MPMNEKDIISSSFLGFRDYGGRKMTDRQTDNVFT